MRVPATNPDHRVGQAIGGYHPAEKWLKDRKGRALTQDDLRHYQRIILALVKTRKVMERIT